MRRVLRFLAWIWVIVSRLFSWGYTGGFKRAAWFTLGLWVVLGMVSLKVAFLIGESFLAAVLGVITPILPTVLLAGGAGFVIWQGFKNILGIGEGRGKKK